MFCLISFLTNLGGAPRIDFALSCLSLLTISILDLIILGLALEAGGTKTTLFKALEEVLQEEREWSYLRPVLLDVAFWKFNISSSLALEAISN